MGMAALRTCSVLIQTGGVMSIIAIRVKSAAFFVYGFASGFVSGLTLFAFGKHEVTAHKPEENWHEPS